MSIKESEYFRRIMQYLVCGRFFDLPVLFNLRCFIYRWVFNMGPGASITRGVLFIRTHKTKGAPLYKVPTDSLIIGSNVHINHDTEIDYTGGLEIGDNVIISPYVLIETHGHGIRAKDEFTTFVAPLKIERGVWIGANVVILPSVSRIGEGGIIGAGSIVTKDVDDWAIVAGNPARKIRMRE